MTTTSYTYSIKSLDEAVAFLDHPYLGKNIREISKVLLGLESNDATAIMGYPDDLKLRSCMTLFAEADSNEKDLRITIPENLDYCDIFDDLFAKYTKTHLLLSVRTTNMGSMYEIEYRIKLKNDLEEKKLLDDIRMRNGNLTVICGRCDMSDVGQL